jgi:hypothetical protein
VLRGTDDVANHPQTLWITLWTAPPGDRQVTLPKGFSFFRSIFERSAFHQDYQGVDEIFPLSSGVFRGKPETAPSPATPGG